MPRPRRLGRLSAVMSAEQAEYWDLDLLISPFSVAAQRLREADPERLWSLLAAAWEIRRDELLALQPMRQGSRPWAWWRFDRGEERPIGDAEIVRLVELDELDDDEVAAIYAAGERDALECGNRVYDEPPRMRWARVLWEARRDPPLWVLRPLGGHMIEITSVRGVPWTEARAAFVAQAESRTPLSPNENNERGSHAGR